MKRWQVTTLVVLGATGLATVAIQASDMLSGVQGNLMGSAIESTGPCRTGAVPLNFGDGTLCVDQYEASPSATCPVQSLSNVQQTQQNLNSRSCQAVSEPDSIPWRFVSMVQAQQLCARSGLRLPTAEEWFQVALQLHDQSRCVLTGSAAAPTGAEACATVSGVYDIVGNVWEWVDAEVTDGNYGDRSLPASGYVLGVGSDGIVVTTTDQPSDEFGADYAKTSTDGVFGAIRGGFYDSGTDGGIFAQNLAVPLNLKTDGIGFRCVASVQ